MKRFIRNYILAGYVYAVGLAGLELYKGSKKYGFDETVNKSYKSTNNLFKEQDIYETVGAVVINSIMWPYRFTKNHIERCKELGIDD